MTDILVQEHTISQRVDGFLDHGSFDRLLALASGVWPGVRSPSVPGQPPPQAPGATAAPGGKGETNRYAPGARNPVCDDA